MKISFGSWAFSFGPYADHPVPFDTVARRVAEAGYDGIEVCGFPPHVTLDQYPDKRSRRRVTSLLEDLNLGISCYSSDLTTVNPVIPGRKQKYLELFRRNVEFCADLLCPAIRVDPVTAPGSIPDDDYNDAINRLAEIWHDAAVIAEDAGIRVLWEFEPGFAFNKPSEVLHIHDKVDHWNFKLIFDTAHSYMTSVVGARHQHGKETVPGGVCRLLDMLHPRIGHVHLTDSDGTLHGDETSTHSPLGHGLLDFDVIAPQLLTLQDVDWWCVDLSFCPGAWELLEPSLEFARKLAGQATR
jgi:sugar phosphate isomerase/epimerase